MSNLKKTLPVGHGLESPGAVGGAAVANTWWKRAGAKHMAQLSKSDLTAIKKWLEARNKKILM